MNCMRCRNNIKSGVLVKGQIYKIVDGNNVGRLVGRDYPDLTLLENTISEIFCDECFLEITGLSRKK